MKRLHILLVALAVAVLGWGGYYAWRAHANLVTLQVRGMDVRKVISKLEWQTWERILVNKDVAGTVTINVRSVPLDEVLNIIALQTNARWTRLYPIYSNSKASVDFKKVVRGDLPIEGSGWTNLLKNPFWLRNTIGGFGNTARAANNLVSAQILNKDLDFTALALSRFAQAQVVPEDTARGNITLKLAQVPFDKAVAQVAKQLHRKWDQIYALQSLRGPTVVHNVQDVAMVRTNAAPSTADTNQQPVAVPIKMAQPPPQRSPEQQVEAFFATMTPEERQKAEEQIAAAQQLQSLPPAERQQKMQEMGSQAAQANQADMERRIQERLRNGTVEQRVDRDRQQLEKRRQRAQKQ